MRRIQPTLGRELRAAAASSPDKPFIRMWTGQWTYRQIDEASDRLASALASKGVHKGSNVSLMLPNCIEFIVCWFALAKLGAVTAPVNTSFRGSSLRMAIDLVESRVMIVHASLLDAFQEIGADLASIVDVIVVGAAGSNSYDRLLEDGERAPRFQEPAVHFSDLCLLLYTSGTTGRSKAAMISHRFVLGQAEGVIEGLGLRTDDVLYCPYPLFHLDAAVMTVAPALLLRGVAAIGERFSVSRYWDEMRALGATVFDFMGATLSMLWKQPPGERDRDHSARLGWGVPLPAWAPEFEARFGCRLVELYGSTEAGAFIYTPLDQPRRQGSCGKPLRRWETQLQDEDGHAVPVGQVGELVVRTREPAMMMRGYFGMPQASLDAFRDLWFHTGDLLREDEDGFLYFVGRRKDLVRRRGENISAAEVEMGIEAHPEVLECAVIGVPSELTEEDVMACVVRRAGSTITPEALAQHCVKAMARFMVPRYFRFLPGLPKTPTDKVEKFRLQEHGITADTWDREAHEASAAKPRTPPA
ncbi:MAG: Long-chain-fatty-acid--CoA ligase [Burkholderiaceae bacterium]|nr:Long-chain-fatty-acid--CoA ligase [Burkholderiaceae bacterium]